MNEVMTYKDLWELLRRNVKNADEKYLTKENILGLMEKFEEFYEVV